MDVFGKSPVALPELILGKAAFAGCFLFFYVGAAHPDVAWFGNALTRQIGVLMGVGGFLLVVFGLLNLGRSAAVGLPSAPTELRTTGLYAVSRNPVYGAAYLACAGSCLYCFHPLNLLFFAVAATVHHRIVMKEEGFLEQRFGERWRAYQSRVPRYIGWVRSEDAPQGPQS